MDAQTLSASAAEFATQHGHIPLNAPTTAPVLGREQSPSKVQGKATMPIAECVSVLEKQWDLMSAAITRSMNQTKAICFIAGTHDSLADKPDIGTLADIAVTAIEDQEDLMGDIEKIIWNIRKQLKSKS